MQTKVIRSVLTGMTMTIALTAAIVSRSEARGRAGHDQGDTIWGRAEKALQECLKSEHHDNNVNTPLKLVGAIAPPGATFAGFDIGFVNEATEQYFVAEGGPNIVPTPTAGQSNASGAVDVLDAENDLVIGRITGFYGRYAPGCAGPDGMGPSGVLVTPDNHLVVDSLVVNSGKATGEVFIFDLNSFTPPYNFSASSAIASIATGAACRADELAYDPKDHILIVGDPADTPSPSASFISLNTYSLLGKVSFPTSTYPKVSGFEQSVWDSQLNGGRFISNVPGVGLVVFNPTTEGIDTIYPLTNSCVGTGLALGPFQKLLVGCTTATPPGLQIVNALNGNLIALIPEIPSMDEGWYNPGDGRWYAPSGTLEQVGVIDAETNTALTPFPPGRTGMRSVAALSENNHVFVIWPPPSLVSTTVLAGSDATKDPCNTMFNLPANAGCIAVYTHESEAAESAQSK
jgi:hypothetical protein